MDRVGIAGDFVVLGDLEGPGGLLTTLVLGFGSTEDSKATVDWPLETLTFLLELEDLAFARVGLASSSSPPDPSTGFFLFLAFTGAGWCLTEAGMSPALSLLRFEAVIFVVTKSNICFIIFVFMRISIKFSRTLVLSFLMAEAI
jgi:hypothetical protein